MQDVWGVFGVRGLAFLYNIARITIPIRQAVKSEMGMVRVSRLVWSE